MSRLKLFNLCQKAPVKNLFKFNPTPAASRCSSSWVPQEEETHTGQKWDDDDYRLVRFIDKPKQVNQNWAVDLIDECPPTPCKERVTWCNGGDGPLGHPKVYINLDKPGCHACGYCGLRFILDNDHH